MSGGPRSLRSRGNLKSVRAQLGLTSRQVNGARRIDGTAKVMITIAVVPEQVAARRELRTLD